MKKNETITNAQLGDFLTKALNKAVAEDAKKATEAESRKEYMRNGDYSVVYLPAKQWIKCSNLKTDWRLIVEGLPENVKAFWDDLQMIFGEETQLHSETILEAARKHKCDIEEYYVISI